MGNDIQRLRQQQIFGGFDPNQEMMDSWGGAWEQPEVYDPNQDMGYQTMDMGGYQPTQTVQQPGVTGVGTPPKVSFEDRLAKIMAAYTPETSARDRQNQLLDNYPQQYEPTKGDRWAAALLGLGERNKPNGDVLAVQNQVLQGPRMRDIEDWKNQTTPGGVASTNENARNMQERQILTGAVQADTQAQRLEESARQADQKAEIAQFRNVTDRMRVNGFKFDLTGPTVKATRTNPDGTIEVQDTGMPTGKLSDIDRINLTTEGRKEIAQINNTGAMNRTVAAGAETVLDSNGKPVPFNPRDPNSTPVTGPVTKPSSAGAGTKTNTLETKRVLNEQLKNAFTLDEASRKFIKKNGELYEYKLRPTVREDGWMPGNQAVTQADIDAYDAFRKEMDPNYMPPKAAAPTPNVTTPSQNINGPQKATGPDYRLKQNPENPNQKARSFDGGKSWQMSNDGGVTWR